MGIFRSPVKCQKEMGYGGTRNISLDTYCIYRLMEPTVYFLGG